MTLAITMFKNIFLLHTNLLRCKHMTLAFSTFSNIFSLHTKRQGSYLTYPNVMMYICFHLKKLLMLTNGIILAIRGCDTLRPPGTQSRSFANNVRDTKYHNWCSGPHELTCSTRSLMPPTSLVATLRWKNHEHGLMMYSVGHTKPNVQCSEFGLSSLHCDSNVLSINLICHNYFSGLHDLS